MSRRYPILFEKEGGWSDWIAPKSGYRFACCDCHLVHDLQLKAFKTASRRSRGWVSLGREIKDAALVYRARRNMRATAQLRRNRRKAAE